MKLEELNNTQFLQAVSAIPVLSQEQAVALLNQALSRLDRTHKIADAMFLLAFHAHHQLNSCSCLGDETWQTPS